MKFTDKEKEMIKEVFDLKRENIAICAKSIAENPLLNGDVIPSLLDTLNDNAMEYIILMNKILKEGNNENI